MTNLSLSKLNKMKNFFWVFGAFIFAIIVLVATPRGLGLTPDSVAYLKSVQGIIDGHGFSYFSVQWPPLYPIVIYVVSLFFGNDYFNGVRFLTACLYGFTFILTGVFIRYLIGNKKSWIISYALAGIICLHPVITHIYFYVLSETLFIPLVLMNLIVLIYYCKKIDELTLKHFIWLSALGNLILITRYAGSTLIVLNVFFICVLIKKISFIKKIIYTLIQIIPALLILNRWLDHVGVSDTETNKRPLVWHPVTSENIYDGLANIGSWILPVIHSNETSIIRTICIFLGSVSILLLFVLAIKSLLDIYECRYKNLTISYHSHVWIISIFGVGYITFLLLVRSYIDPHVMFDNRFLSPIFIPIIILPIYYATRIKNWRIYLGCLIFIAFIYSLPIQQLRSWLLISYFNGIELNDKTRLNSNILNFLRNCPKNLSIYADNPWNLNLEFKSMVKWIPTYHFFGTGLPDPNYKNKLHEFSGNVDIVVVESRQSEVVFVMNNKNDFHQIYNQADGIIWQRIHSYKKCE